MDPVLIVCNSRNPSGSLTSSSFGGPPPPTLHHSQQKSYAYVSQVILRPRRTPTPSGDPDSSARRNPTRPLRLTSSRHRKRDLSLMKSRRKAQRPREGAAQFCSILETCRPRRRTKTRTRRTPQLLRPRDQTYMTSVIFFDFGPSRPLVRRHSLSWPCLSP